MDLSTNIYGTLFIGAITVGLFYCAYGYWNDNPFFSIFLGFLGIIFACYSIGLFLSPLITDLLKKLKKRKK